MPHYVYVLESIKDGRYYIGETANVQQRLDFHNAGLQRSTRGRIPFKRLHYFAQTVAQFKTGQ